METYTKPFPKQIDIIFLDLRYIEMCNLSYKMLNDAYEFNFMIGVSSILLYLTIPPIISKR